MPANEPAALQQGELAEHRKTYRWFVRGVFAVAAGALLTLMVLGYAFSSGFG